MNQITELRIKMGRNNKEMSKMALSRELGVAVQTIRAWEAGRSEPGAMARRLIKELYGVEIKKEVHNERG